MYKKLTDTSKTNITGIMLTTNLFSNMLKKKNCQTCYILATLKALAALEELAAFEASATLVSLEALAMLVNLQNM